MPVAPLDTYRIKDYDQLNDPAKLLDTVLEAESGSGVDKNYKVTFPTVIQTVANNLPGTNRIKSAYKAVRTYDTLTPGYQVGFDTLVGLDSDTLCVGTLARVEFPSPSRDYILVFDPNSSLYVYTDGSFSGQKQPARWVEKNSLDNLAAAIDDFNPFQAEYKAGDNVKYTLNGALRIFSAKLDLVKSTFTNNQIPAPTGLTTDANWSEISADVAPNYSRLGQLTTRFYYNSERDTYGGDTVEDLIARENAGAGILYTNRLVTVELGPNAGTYRVVYDTATPQFIAWSDGLFSGGRNPSSLEKIAQGGAAVKDWSAGVQKANSLVTYNGNLYRVKVDIANGQANPENNTQYYQLITVPAPDVTKAYVDAADTNLQTQITTLKNTKTTVGNWTTQSTTIPVEQNGYYYYPAGSNKVYKRLGPSGNFNTNDLIFNRANWQLVQGYDLLQGFTFRVGQNNAVIDNDSAWFSYSGTGSLQFYGAAIVAYNGNSYRYIAAPVAAGYTLTSAADFADTTKWKPLTYSTPADTNKAYVDAADTNLQAQITTEKNRMDTLVTGAPTALDTLKEIADQLAADEAGAAAMLATIQQHTQQLANDVVHRTGDESIAGNKTFTKAVKVITQDANLDLPVAQFIAPNNAVVDNFTQLHLGTSLTNYNAGEMRFVYQGNNSTANRIEFGFYGDQGDAAFCYTAAGQVGLGYPNPTERLQVRGNVKASGFIGNGSQLTNLNLPIQQDLTSKSTTAIPSVKAVADAVVSFKRFTIAYDDVYGFDTFAAALAYANVTAGDVCGFNVNNQANIPVNSTVNVPFIFDGHNNYISISNNITLTVAAQSTKFRNARITLGTDAKIKITSTGGEYVCTQFDNCAVNGSNSSVELTNANSALGLSGNTVITKLTGIGTVYLYDNSRVVTIDSTITVVDRRTTSVGGNGGGTTIYQLAATTIAATGAQTITLPRSASAIINITVLEASGYVRTIWLDNYSVAGTTLTITANANLKAGDKIAGSYY